MERIPDWLLWLAAVILAGLAVWSVTEENWSGAIIGAVLAVACVAYALRRRPTT